MTSTLLLKEGRALAPIWLGAVVTIVAGTQAGMLLGSLLAFILGAAALGVFSIGHEYANRTLTSLLAQPLSRTQLLLSKLVVLVPLLVLLSLVAALVLFRADGIERMFGGVARAPRFGALAAGPVHAALVSRWQLAIVVLTPLLGLCVGPSLTMVFRNVTAGLVFTLAVPAALWIAGQLARAASVGFDFVELEISSPFGYSPSLVLMIVGVLAVSVIAAVHGGRLFIGLEALDGPRELLPAVKRPRRADSAAATSHRRRSRRRGPLLFFVQKEVRLYGVLFAVAALYTVGWIAMWLARADAYIASGSFEALVGMYGLFMALLVGAISVAEERALGVSDTQRLLPWPFWKQSLVKLTTVGLITLILGLAIPTALEKALPLIGASGLVGPMWGYFRLYLPTALSSAAATVLLTTLFSCYASTLCVGGLRALLVALPLSFSLTSLYVNLLWAVSRLDYILRIKYGLRELWWQGLPTATSADFTRAYLVSQKVNAVVFLGFVTLIFYLWLRNSRSGERGMSMARKQLPWVFGYVALATVVVRGGGSLIQWWLLTH